MGVEESIKKLFLFVAVFALFTSGITTSAFADGDDDDDGDKKKPKTLEEHCAKKKGFDKLICEAIFLIQDMLGMVKDDVTILQDEVEELQSIPAGIVKSIERTGPSDTVPASTIFFSTW